MSDIVTSNIFDIYSIENVGCFLCSQALVAEYGSPEGAKVLPAVTSLYRSYGLEKHFNTGGQRYFSFARDVLPNLCGLEVLMHEITQKERTIHHIKQLLSKYKRVIVPCDVGKLSYTAYYGTGGQRHYLIVDGFDANTGEYRVYDNLHIDPRGLIGEYSHHMMSEDTLVAIIDSFWNRYIIGCPIPNPSLFLAERRYMLSCITPVKSLDQRDALRCILFCMRLVISERSDTEHARWVDEGNIEHLISEVDRKADSKDLEYAVKRYVVDSRFADAYLDYLLHCFPALHDSEINQLKNLQKLSARDSAIRAPILVRILSGRTIHANDWSEAKLQLTRNDHQRVSIFKELLQSMTPISESDMERPEFKGLEASSLK